MTSFQTTRNIARLDHVDVFHYAQSVPVIAVLLVMVYSSVALRFWTRACIRKSVGWDDYTIILSVIFFSAFSGTLLGFFYVAGNSPSLSSMPAAKVQLFIQLILVAELCYYMAMMTLKISLAIFFLRILVVHWQRWIIIASISISTLFGVAVCFFGIFQCGSFSHISVAIHRLILGQCVARHIVLGMSYTYAGLGTISDWTCVIVPIFVLCGSTMPSGHKMLASALLLFAMLGSIASVIRMAYISSYVVNGDFVGNLSKLSIWSILEAGIGITVSSLAMTRPLCVKGIEKFRGFMPIPRKTTLLNRSTQATKKNAPATRHTSTGDYRGSKTWQSKKNTCVPSRNTKVP